MPAQRPSSATQGFSTTSIGGVVKQKTVEERLVEKPKKQQINTTNTTIAQKKEKKIPALHLNLSERDQENIAFICESLGLHQRRNGELVINKTECIRQTLETLANQLRDEQKRL